jgi:hypothetical protein
MQFERERLAFEVMPRSSLGWVTRYTSPVIRTMSRENPLWGAPRIHGELLKLGIEKPGGPSLTTT